MHVSAPRQTKCSVGMLASMTQFELSFHRSMKSKAKKSYRLCPVATFALAVSCAAVTACRMDDPALRVSLILHELAPSVHLGQALADARRVYPTLAVQHEGELHDYFPRSDTTRIYPVAVTVLPTSAEKAAALDTVVQSFEFVTSPSSAVHFARHVAEVFQARPRIACGSLAMNGRDSLLTFDTHRRGGVTITFPESRADYR